MSGHDHGDHGPERGVDEREREAHDNDGHERVDVREHEHEMTAQNHDERGEHTVEVETDEVDDLAEYGRRDHRA